MTFLTTLGLENVSLEQQLERREKGQERESDGGVQKEEEGQRLDHRQDQDLGHLSVHDHSCDQHCLQQQQQQQQQQKQFFEGHQGQVGNSQKKNHKKRNHQHQGQAVQQDHVQGQPQGQEQGHTSSNFIMADLLDLPDLVKFNSLLKKLYL